MGNGPRGRLFMRLGQISLNFSFFQYPILDLDLQAMGIAKTDITFSFGISDNCLSGGLQYAVDAFAPATVEAMASCFQVDLFGRWQRAATLRICHAIAIASLSLIIARSVVLPAKPCFIPQCAM